MLPAHCRVAATLKPSSDSDIKMELWLPLENWNGTFEMVGNGGMGRHHQLSTDEPRRCATDTPTPLPPTPAMRAATACLRWGIRKKIVDFGWRAVHDTVAQSKTLIKAYYGQNSKYSYWNGCSTGGRQALVEVTKFPDDFDGVLAGAPANPHIHLHAAGVERSIEEMKNPAGALSQANVEALHKAILAKCDALDGVKDGLIGDPTKCHFDPASLLCKGEESEGCLTSAQVQTVKIVFADVKNKKGEIIWTGFQPGGELQYAALKSIPTQPGGGWDSIRILGHQDADYDFHRVRSG